MYFCSPGICLGCTRYVHVYFSCLIVLNHAMSVYVQHTFSHFFLYGRSSSYSHKFQYHYVVVVVVVVVVVTNFILLRSFSIVSVISVYVMGAPPAAGRGRWSGSTGTAP